MSAEQVENPMLKARIIKVVCNIGVGEGGDKLQKAEKVMGMVTGAKPCRTLSKVTSRDWGLRVGAPIGVKATLRGDAMDAFLRKVLDIRQFKVPDYSFDDGGNLNIGVPDYTDFPGQKYDPEIGIFGMDIAVVIERPGGRVARRRLAKRKVARSHKVSRDEAMQLMKEQFNIEVI